MIRQYEMMLVLKPDFDTSSTQKAQDLLKKLVGSNPKIKSLSFLGKKPLAYPIKKFQEGIYCLAALEAEAIIAADVEKQTRLNTDVIRYLLTVQE